MTEVELKLVLPAAAADRFRTLTMLPADSVTSDHHATYFDTPSHALSNAGLTLRIRRSGETAIQTVKSSRPGATGLSARSEWEQAVKGDRPVLGDESPASAVLGKKLRDLSPIFAVELNRTTWLIDTDQAVIELVLNQGRVFTANRESPVCEVELELKQGDVAALFAFAAQLSDAVPLRLGVLTKPERGYRLRGPEADMFKAEPVALTDEMGADQAFRDIAGMCLRQFRLNEDLILALRNADALHQARVALRRLRSAFAIFKPLIGSDPVAAELREELRWLAAELGKARDLDVLLGRSPTGALRERLETERAAVYDQVTNRLDSARVRALMLKLVQWLADGDWRRNSVARPCADQPAREFAAKALSRRMKKVKRGAGAVGGSDDAARHEVRKDVKKLRYAAEFFELLFAKKGDKRRRKRFFGTLEELQDQLGGLNDLATAPELLKKLGILNDPHAASLIAQQDKSHLIAAAVRAHSALVDTRQFWR